MERHRGIPTLTNYLQERLTGIGRERLLMEIELDLPSGFDQYVQDIMNPSENTNQFSIILSVSHKSHPAGLAAVKGANKIIKIANKVLPDEQKFSGSVLIMAKSMQDGQSKDIADGLKSVQPIFDKHNVEPLFVIREKDVNKALLKHPEREDEIKEEWNQNRNNQRLVLGNAIRDRKAIILLPEGTVESGRQKEGGLPGEINGMVDLQPNSISYISALARRQKKEPLFFFVGVTEENHIYDPITESVTEDAKKVGRLKAIPYFHSFVRSPMRAVMDYPATYSEIVEEYGTNGVLESGIPEQLSGERMASLLPYGQGVYSEPTLLDRSTRIKRRYI